MKEDYLIDELMKYIYLLVDSSKCYLNKTSFKYFFIKVIWQVAFTYLYTTPHLSCHSSTTQYVKNLDMKIVMFAILLWLPAPKVRRNLVMIHFHVSVNTDQKILV